MENLSTGKNIFLERKSSLENLKNGQSLSVSGVCLTVEEKTQEGLKFFLSSETLQKTWFDHLNETHVLNFEYPLETGEKMGGHYVQGHIDTYTKISSINELGNSWDFVFNKPLKTNYIIEKGFIAIEGISLTINDVLKDKFSVRVIPETWKSTNLSEREEGSFVNLEYDIMAKYAEKIIKN